jgi:hypothetical protein
MHNKYIFLILAIGFAAYFLIRPQTNPEGTGAQIMSICDRFPLLSLICKNGKIGIYVMGSGSNTGGGTGNSGSSGGNTIISGKNRIQFLTPYGDAMLNPANSVNYGYGMGRARSSQMCSNWRTVPCPLTGPCNLQTACGE